MRIAFFLTALSVSLMGCDRLKSISSNPFTSMAPEASDTGQGPATVPPLTPTRRSVEIIDQRVMAERVTNLDVTSVQGGVLVTASGVPSRAGGFNAELVATSRENGRLTLQLLFQYPQSNSTGAPGTITVSKLLSREEVAGVRTIQVQAAQNSLSRRN